MIVITRISLASLVSFVLAGCRIHAVCTDFIPILAVLHILRSVEYIAVSALSIDTKCCTDINCRLAHLTLLGSHYNNTIGTLRTIDSSSRSIFQHVYLTDILRIDF